MMSKRNNRKDWADSLAGDAVAGQKVNQRLLAKISGSEWAERRVIESQLINKLSTDAGDVILVGPQKTALKRLQIPTGKVALVQELNYFVQANGGGDPTADDLGTILTLKLNGEERSLLPKFRLDAYARGTNGLLFGAIPLDFTLPENGKLELISTGPGAGASNFDLYISILLRLEPKWFMEAAGLLDFANP